MVTTKKGAGKLVFILPQTVKQLCRLKDMVQFYRDIWARCNEILAPVTNLTGECGHNKVTKTNKTKKSHDIRMLSTSKSLTF